MGKPRSRSEDAVRRNAIYWLQIENWRASTRNREGWRQKTAETMA
jgi:hypothetical protein